MTASLYNILQHCSCCVKLHLPIASHAFVFRCLVFTTSSPAPGEEGMYESPKNDYMEG